MSYYVYILSNPASTVLYTGVTNDLARRVHEHKEKVVEGFTKRYNLSRLVYYEVLDDDYSAISQEKQIKGGSRAKKLALVQDMNPQWRNLSMEL